ncbi:TPR repeat protein-like protein [Mytilinidion resinicola]|uniref:TPR repeat protein-like protein n=1 Tax=Mytilinidion resinicola TaxID=574789 RepID=A0A6A6YGY0_9PEZI|nr:TPR repeat protein-like protein [Mytilinidion resinicola]KAF2807793.1 TPR repeat protein-like protein [Mytilinidion resinicola]
MGDLKLEDAPAQPSAALPPAMASIQAQSTHDVLQNMNRVPLFMTTLDDTDGEGGENVELEALKALAYEGTRAEVAENFRQQGNDLARNKMWSDAKEFYNKAIAALRAPLQPQDAEEGPADMDVVVVDEESEREKERHIEEASYINRALCNLEKKNYRSCIQDCASTLRLNPSNLKAFYRSASACLALDKLPEASDACNRGLAINASNGPLKTLATKITARKESLESIARVRREREERKKAEERSLKLALKSRNIVTRTSEKAPDMEDAAIQLEKPLDPTSALSIPVILLYPMHAHSDFIKAFQETETLMDHLQYILPVPWDQAEEYTKAGVECYMETTSGGLIKAGKKIAMGKILGSGKCEILDGLVKVNVVPKEKASGWIEEFKKRRSQ